MDGLVTFAFWTYFQGMAPYQLFYEGWGGKGTWKRGGFEATHHFSKAKNRVPAGDPKNRKQRGRDFFA
jgi:hypothetical protein